ADPPGYRTGSSRDEAVRWPSSGIVQGPVFFALRGREETEGTEERRKPHGATEQRRKRSSGLGEVEPRGLNQSPRWARATRGQGSSRTPDHKHAIDPPACL